MKAPPRSLLQRAAGDRGGLLPLAAVAVIGAVFSASLWAPFAQPAAYLSATLPAGNVLGAFALGGLMVVFGRPLSAGVQRASARLPANARFLVPPLLATSFFLLSWAGSHVGREGQVGLVPEIVFPAVSAVFGFTVARWNGSVQRALEPFFVGRDQMGPRTRFVLALAIPTALSFALNALLGTDNPARNAQLLVIVGMVTGYLLMAPRATAASK